VRPPAGPATVELVGRIDRIDRMDRTDRGEGGRPDDACLELLDYKTRPFTDLRRAQAEPGEDVQLHLYGLLAGPGAGQAAYLSFERPADPARPGAASVRRVDAAAPFALWVDAIGARLRRDLGRIAAGAPLPAIGADSICARCEMRGLCRRDFWSGPAEPERGPDT
jgi:ATP-dependent helicase/nuclease subunit B